jgi:hypothetical protein
MNAETYALLREAHTRVDLRRASQILATILGDVRLDVLKSLQACPGILAVGLDRAAAQSAVNQLTAAGMPVFAMPQSKIISPPPVVDLLKGEVRPDGFAIDGVEGAMVLPWDQIILIDSMRVKGEKQVKVMETEEPRMTARGGRTSYRVTRKTRREMVWQEFFDAVCYDPWVHVRVNRDTFRFAATGLPVHPTREQNFQAFVVVFKARCTNALEGPGMALLFDGKPETRGQVASLKAYDNHILWEVQLRFRKKE